MNPHLQACFPDQRLSKLTILAMLDSSLDTSKAIEVSSGNIIDISKKLQSEINVNLNNGTWIYFENRLPKRILLTSQNWEILSFNPSSRLVCVQMNTKSGMRVLSFTLPQLSPKF
jgi:hypothetical protein